MKRISCVCILFAALAVASCASASGQPFAQEAPDHEVPVLLAVGSGTAYAIPDQAKITASVRTIGSAPLEALQANSALMERVHAALVGIGVDRGNIETTALVIENAEGVDENGNYVVKRDEYEARNSIVVTVNDLALVPRFVPALVEAGANQVSDINFSISDIQALRSEARQTAIEDAMRQASEMAAGAGVALGRILRIEPGNAVRGWIAGAASVGLPVTRVSEESFAVPIMPERQQITETVTITFRIE